MSDEIISKMITEKGFKTSKNNLRTHNVFEIYQRIQSTHKVIVRYNEFYFNTKKKRKF